MLMPNPSLRSVIFWQWANQTLNVAVSPPRTVNSSL